MELEPSRTIKIFYCYAHEDKLLRDRLSEHLAPLKRNGRILDWCDQQIEPGGVWEHEIEQQMNTADIILLLISSAFIASDYCYTKEMQHAFERHKAGEVRIIPIILRSVYWKKLPFAQFQVLPTDAKPLVLWPNLDEALEDVIQGISKVVDTLATAELNRYALSKSSPLLEEDTEKFLKSQQLYRKDDEKQAELVRWVEEERRHVVETSMSPQFSQTLLPTTRSQALIRPSTGEGQQPKEPLTRLSLTKGVIRGTRLLVCWIILMAYWLFLGYMFFLWIFPKRILRISGSTNLYMFLRGDFKKTEMLKILIVFFSLTFDWFMVGTILSHFSHLTLFTVQEVWIYGPLLTGIFLCLFIGYVILYYIVKWPYTAAMNIRKTMEIIVVITLLTFVSSSFGASFMYFPLFTGVIALCLFFGGLVSLGGTQHQEDSGSLNARLERRLQTQLEDERQSKEYFKERKKQL